MSVGFDDVVRASREIAPVLVRTPCLASRTLSEITGAQVVLKFENLQFTASFKERGALWKLLSLSPAERARGVVAMSAGNHAQAVAHHAKRLGIAATLVMPRYTPGAKVENTRRFGAEVVLHGDDVGEAEARALALARERGLVLVHPYDDPRIVAGAGSVALEMFEAYPDLDALLVPVGGGGLVAGCALAASGAAPACAVYGVETVRFPSMLQALRGEPVVCGRDTIAEGIAVKRPGVLPLAIVRERVAEILLVEELDLESALLLLLDVEKTLVEGAGAAALAALLRHRARFAGKKVGVILSGGNFDLLVLSSVIERGLARDGRLVRLRLELADRVGALAELTRLLAEAGANIVEVRHERAFGSVALKSAEVELVLATRGREHLADIVSACRAGGYAPQLPDA
jgi:threonine dehydratase